MVRLKSEDYRWCCPPGEPGAFDCSCDNCEMVSGTFVTSEPGTGFTCLVCGEEVEGRALWGIEWAAVAWMAMSLAVGQEAAAEWATVDLIGAALTSPDEPDRRVGL